MNLKIIRTLARSYIFTHFLSRPSRNAQGSNTNNIFLIKSSHVEQIFFSFYYFDILIVNIVKRC